MWRQSCEAACSCRLLQARPKNTNVFRGNSRCSQTVFKCSDCFQVSFQTASCKPGKGLNFEKKKKKEIFSCIQDHGDLIRWSGADSSFEQVEHFSRAPQNFSARKTSVRKITFCRKREIFFVKGNQGNCTNFCRWVSKRMNNEFAEMLQTTTGRLLDQITVSNPVSIPC